MSHAEIAGALEPAGLDRATLYRNLIDLTDAGLLSRTDHGDHVWRFELRDNAHGQTEQHPHFTCIDCGEGRMPARYEYPDIRAVPITPRDQKAPF